LTVYLSQLSEGFNRVELFGFFECGGFVGSNQIDIELFFGGSNHCLFFGALFLKRVGHSAGVVVALECPRVGVFGGFEKSHSSGTLLRDVIIDVLAVHVLLCEVAALVLENFTIHGQYFRKETDLCLFFQLVAGVAVNEYPLSRRMGMKVQETKEFTFFVEMHDHFFDCVDGGVCFGTGVNVASIEIDSVGVDSVSPAGNSIRVEDGKQVEYKFIT